MKKKKKNEKGFEKDLDLIGRYFIYGTQIWNTVSDFIGPYLTFI